MSKKPVTQRSEVENAIKLALEETIEGLQILDNELRYIYINNAAAEQGKSSHDELIGRTMRECYPGIESTVLYKNLKFVMESGLSRRFENEFSYPDGTKCWFDLFLEPYSQGVLIRSIDITERKALETQLRHSQKMDAIGRLAGGIAHDFNNKLGIMLAYCELMKSQIDDTNIAVNNYLDKIMTAVNLSANLTRQLLAFSRKQVLDIKAVNLNDILKNNEDGLNKVIGEHISILYKTDDKLKDAKVDPSQIDQVILNLCINARDSMPNGGQIIIETRNTRLDADYARTHADVTPGEYIMLAVSDSGTGMSREIQSKIFEPFFTTKTSTGGTGLGLSSVHGIVHQSHGHIWVYSEPGKGSVFKIYFPVLSDEPQENVTSLPLRAVTRSTGDACILLVEDDPLLREAYELALKGADYTVLCAPTAQAAMQLIKNSKKKVDLLLTDVVLPQMSGRELAEILCKTHTDLKVVYMSGYTENSIVHQGILDTDSILLQKPISLTDLIETLEKVLEGKLKKALV